MVLMHRKDIIEQYGVAPEELIAGASSVVPKGITAPINVAPDDSKLEPPHQETPHADVLPSMAAGAIKGFVSDPAMLAGLGYGAYYWGKNKLLGNPDADFAEGLYSEGGVERVQQHINERTQQLKQSHPDWNDEAVRAEIEKYTATPEFFQFNTDQMIGPLRYGLQTAYKVNQATGVDKTPNQEGFTDDVLQTIGGALTPTGWLKLGKVAEKFAGRMGGKIIGNTLDYTVVPGTQSFTPGNIAANVAGGAVVDEVVRHATGDPTVLGGDALLEFQKDVGSIGSGEPVPSNVVLGAGPDLPNGVMPLTPEEIPEDLKAAPEPQKQAFIDLPPEEQRLVAEALRKTTNADPTATTVVVGAALALAGARAAFRGRVQPSVPIANPSSVAEDAANRRLATTGLNNPADVPAPVSAIQAIDRGIDVDAPVEQLGREFGVEDQVRADLAQFISPQGRETNFNNFFEEGLLIDGSRVHAPKITFDAFSTADPATRQAALDRITSQEILSELQETRVQRGIQLAQAQIAQNLQPQNPLVAQRVADLQRTSMLWRTYDPSVRRVQPGVDEATLQQRANVRNPEVDRLVTLYEDANRAFTEHKYRSGVISHQQYTDELTRPQFASLWEHNDQSRVRHDPRQERNRDRDEAEIRIHNPESPLATMRVRMQAQSNWISSQVGKRRIAQELLAADPAGNEIRVLPNGATADQGTGSFTYTDRGRDVTIQTARPSVADAVNQFPVDDGVAINVIDTVRKVAQFGMVHGLMAPAQAPRSLFYDMVSHYLTQRAGTSVGYASRWLRQLERHHFGSNPTISRAADLVDMVDLPGRLAAHVVTGAQSIWYASKHVLGKKMMQQAISRDGFFGHLAQLPGGQQMLTNLGGRLHAHFTASWYGDYLRYSGSRPHEMVAEFRLLGDRVGRDYERWAAGTPRGLLTQFGNLYQAYTSIFNTIGSLARMTHFSQNHAIERVGRQQVPEDVARLLAEQSRRVSGNLAAMPNNKAVRIAGKTIPFFRIGLQSFRHLIHAMASRGQWDSGLVVARMGAMAGAAYGSAKMIEEMGLTDWYYEQLNDFERNGTLRLPTMESLHSKLTTGEYLVDQENPDKNFYTLNLPPEVALFLATPMYGLEQLGFLNRGSNRGNTSAEKDMLYALGQTFSVGTVPGVNALANLTFGTKLDLTASLRGRAPVSDIPGAKGWMGNTPGGIPSSVAEATKSLFGFNGMVAMQSLDAGLQDFKANEDAVRAMSRAWDEGKNITLEKITPTVPGLWKAKEKVYGTSAISAEVQKQNKIADELREAYSNEFTPAGVQRGENRPRIQDPDVRAMLYITNKFYNTGAMPKLQKALNGVRAEVNDINASKATLDFKTHQERLEQKQKEMRPWHEHMMDHIKRYEEYLRTAHGEVFQRAGLEPSIDSVHQLVRQSAR